MTRTMTTRWSNQVDKTAPLPEYPRPQMVRAGWVNLNGQWQYAIRTLEAEPVSAERDGGSEIGEGSNGSEDWDGKITVPFPVESSLSGVQRRVGPKHVLWYRRSFTAPELSDGARLLLHFGAVDWECAVWINGRNVGSHRGGFDPFSFDITDALNPGGAQEIQVRVWDPSDAGDQPRGKQSENPKGIWYEPVTGIWQTVWLEPVPQTSIRSLRVVPDIDAGSVHLTVECRSLSKTAGQYEGYRIRAVVRDGGRVVSESLVPLGQALELGVPSAKLWSPDHPFLYDLDVELVRQAAVAAENAANTDNTANPVDLVVDKVSSYFGMRKISVGRDEHGRPTLMLNNTALFQYGPLDQGWWPDGLYTAPTDDALRFDIEATKAYGFNMIRKHVKVEPARWYYHCDQLGMLVWQDMPSAMPDRALDPSLWVGPWDKNDAVRKPDSARQFEQELQGMIDGLYNHPSIIMWVPFNEGWGQYDTERIAAWTAAHDPSRLVNAVSGWTDRGCGTVLDIHEYPGPSFETSADARVPVLGEFGGLGLGLPGHLWVDDGNWGYQSYAHREALLGEYSQLMKALAGPIARGLGAAVYTQTTDVEREVNGLITYDRELHKLDPKDLKPLHDELYRLSRATSATAAADTATATVIASAANHAPADPTADNHAPSGWRYVQEAPSGAWTMPDFDDQTWSVGASPFKSEDTMLALSRGTDWSAGEIWMRRTFTLPSPAEFDRLWIEALLSAERVTVYVNGSKVAAFSNFREARRHYRHFDVSDHVHVLRRGENTIAVHAVQKDGEKRAVDVGLYGLPGFPG